MIDILALIGMPIYDSYVMRVKLTELNFEIMERYRYLQTKFVNTDVDSAIINITGDLRDPNTITTRTNFNFYCMR